MPKSLPTPESVEPSRVADDLRTVVSSVIGGVGQVDALALRMPILKRRRWLRRRLTPICLSSVRFTSAMRTFRLTWSGVANGDG